MASSNLVFEFSRRWKEIGARLFGPNLTPGQQEALNMLEQNMRDLEDAWPTSSGGGGTNGMLGINYLGGIAGTATTVPGGTTIQNYEPLNFRVTVPVGTTRVGIWGAASFSQTATAQHEIKLKLRWNGVTLTSSGSDTTSKKATYPAGDVFSLNNFAVAVSSATGTIQAGMEFTNFGTATMTVTAPHLLVIFYGS